MAKVSPRYTPAAKAAKAGTRFVRMVVESTGSLLHKIELEDDLGIDAIIELVLEGTPAHSQCAVQIKSGPSYFLSRGTKCQIPIGKHRDYWSKHPLPVIGVVYPGTGEIGYWIDLKAALKANPDAKAIRFKISRVNQFDALSFETILVPALLRTTSKISFELACELATSNDYSECNLAFHALFRRFPNQRKTWELLTSAVRDRNLEDIPKIIIYGSSPIIVGEVRAFRSERV